MGGRRGPSAVWQGERAAKSLAKWRTTAREAAKQARRSWFPEVAELASTADVAALVAEADLAVVLHEAATLLAVRPRRPRLGLDRRRRRPRGRAQRRGGRGVRGRRRRAVRLGAEVLRTSTAGVAAVAALLSRTPRWA